MPRKKPREVARPFYTSHPQIARALAAGATSLPISIPRSAKRDMRDWVTREEDEFIEAHDNKRSQREIGTPREQMCLDTQRIITKGREGELSSKEFRVWMNAKENNGESVADLLRDHDQKKQFKAVILYVFYLNHRWTPVDEMRQRYRSAEGVARTAGLSEQCHALARELRQWAAPLSECALREHSMPDEMRGRVLRAAGDGYSASNGPGTAQYNKGWLDWYAEWLNETAVRFKAAGGNLRGEKEAAFQIKWYQEASRRTNDNCSDMGSRSQTVPARVSISRTPSLSRSPQARAVSIY